MRSWVPGISEDDPDACCDWLEVIVGQRDCHNIEMYPKSDAVLGRHAGVLIRPKSSTLYEVHDEIRSGSEAARDTGARGVRLLGKLLEIWLREGPYGPIVDGVTTLIGKERCPFRS